MTPMEGARGPNRARGPKGARGVEGARGFSRAIVCLSVFLSASVIGGAVSTTQTPTPSTAPVGNPDSGKRLYQKHTCFFCHGTAGQGGLDGARLAVVARNLQSFTRYVRQPAGRMPAFTDKILSDQELADIFAFVRSLPPAKAVKDIPLLDQLKR